MEEQFLSEISRSPDSISEKTKIVIIGLGSNINSEYNIRKALEILKTKVRVLKISTLLQTKPIGLIDQPDFTNGAVKIETNLSHKKLNVLLKKIEDQMGRDRSEQKKGPRCIDLDIVVFDDKIVDEDYYARDFLQKSVSELTGSSFS